MRELCNRDNDDISSTRSLAVLEEDAFPLSCPRSIAIAPQVTGGGVPLSELNLKTMHSKVLPGVFLCGEIVDVFGRIGGFNFYWAWVSGRLAGLSAAAPSEEDASPLS